MVEAQLCKLRGTSDTFVGRAYSIKKFSSVILFCVVMTHTSLAKFHFLTLRNQSAKVRSRKALAVAGTTSRVHHKV